MSYAGILATVNLYKTEKAQLTGELSNILMSITDASKQTSELMQKENQERASVKENYDADSTEYKVEMDDIDSEYQAKLQDINSWEAELQQEKQNKETQVQATSSFLDSFTEVLKNNVKKDFTYGQSSK